MPNEKRRVRKGTAKPASRSDQREAKVEDGAAASADADGPSGGGLRTVCPIVGLGASAGGLEAFREFLLNTPADSGLAFVLLQHLSPEHKSSLQELLSRQTQIPVTDVTKATPVKPNHVYLLPPNAVLTIKSGVLRPSKPKQARGDRTPIDIFFRSLAEDQGDNAACIVLSGTGSDGTLGLKAIKEHGGLAMALHELATNAVRPHGSDLDSPRYRGRSDGAAAVARDRGPSVVPPEEGRFGRMLIELLLKARTECPAVGDAEGE